MQTKRYKAVVRNQDNIVINSTNKIVEWGDGFTVICSVADKKVGTNDKLHIDIERIDKK